MSIRKGTAVSWKWGNGSDDVAALVIEPEDGGRVLKLAGEVDRT